MAYTHLTENPTVVNLQELSPNGAEFVYTREGGELDEALKGVIGENPYHITLKIQPMGNAYMASGRIEAAMDLVCSLCADDLKFPVKEDFNEILILAAEMERTATTAKVNHSSELQDDGPNCTELNSPVFHVDEFLYELIAITEPIKPTGRPDCDQSCPSYQEALRNGWLSGENHKDFKKENAFSALKGIKLND